MFNENVYRKKRRANTKKNSEHLLFLKRKTHTVDAYRKLSKNFYTQSFLFKFTAVD